MPAIVVYGGQFGDEGKGKLSELMARLYDAVAVVRVGGSQADHTDTSGKVFNVLPTSAGQRISVLPSGSYIVLERLLHEIEILGLTPDNLIIDMAACIVTSANKYEAETSGRTAAIASHGLGTRNAIHERLRGNFSKGTQPADYEVLKPFIQNTREYYADWLAQGRFIIIEGTQGYGLSNHLFDMYPYTTSRTITPQCFCGEAGISPLEVVERVMCLRTYPIRVGGNSGPLPYETSWEVVTQLSGAKEPIIEKPVNTGVVHRVAYFDKDIVLRAIAETEPSIIALNMLDYIDINCRLGEHVTEKAVSFLDKVESEIQRHVNFVGVSKRSLLPWH